MLFGKCAHLFVAVGFRKSFSADTSAHIKSVSDVSYEAEPKAAAACSSRRRPTPHVAHTKPYFTYPVQAQPDRMYMVTFSSFHTKMMFFSYYTSSTAHDEIPTDPASA